MTGTRAAIWLGVVVAALIVGGCAEKTPGISPERAAVTREWFDLIDQIGKVFASIQDQASAEAAKPKLEAFLPKLDALAERRQKLGEPSEIEKLKLIQKFGERETEASYIFSREPQRISAQFPQLVETIRSLVEKSGGGQGPGGG